MTEKSGVMNVAHGLPSHVRPLAFWWSRDLAQSTPISDQWLCEVLCLLRPSLPSMGQCSDKGAAHAILPRDSHGTGLSLPHSCSGLNSLFQPDPGPTTC